MEMEENVNIWKLRKNEKNKKKKKRGKLLYKKIED